MINSVDGFDLTDGLPVLDTVTTIASVNDGSIQLVQIVNADGSAVTNYVTVTDALVMLLRPRRAPQWQNLAARNVSRVIRCERHNAVLNTIVLESDNDA